MATKPTIADAEFASDALFASGVQSGQAVRADPGAATRKQGFIAKMLLVPKWVNFTIHQLYLWCVYLNDLHNSAGFLSEAYTWTNNHEFNGGVGITVSGTVFTADVIATGGVTGALVASTGLVRATTDFTYATPPSRVKLIPLLNRDENGAGTATGWSRALTGTTVKCVCSSDGDELQIDLSPYLPNGSTLTKVRAGITQGNTGAVTDLTMKVYRNIVDKTTPSSVAVAQLGATDTADDSGDDVLDSGAISQLVDTANHYYMVQIKASSAAATDADTLWWIEVTFTDPGPRNF